MIINSKKSKFSTMRVLEYHQYKKKFVMTSKEIIKSNIEFKCDRRIGFNCDDGKCRRNDIVDINLRSEFSSVTRKWQDGKEYLFGYYEYTGDNYDSDMAKLAKEPRNVQWLKICDPCQIPLKGHNSWAQMDQINYN